MGKPNYLYFNVRSRGELPRMIIAVGKCDSNQTRIELADWPGSYKADTPYGQLPTLEVDGHKYAQKLAISLFFARKGGLYPASGTPLETLKYDHAFFFIEDFLEQIIQGYVEEFFAKKTEKLTAVKTDLIPAKLPLIEKLLKDNGTGYFVGNKVSIVDLSCYDTTEHIIDLLGAAYLDKFPLLKAHFARIGKIEELKKYIASRPPTTIPF